MKNSVKPILDQLDILNITEFTTLAHSFEEEYNLPPDDKDYVTFHKGKDSPYICDKIEVCDQYTTVEPIYKDWYMTINYHS